MAEEKMVPVSKDDRRLALVIVDVQKKFIRDDKDATLESAKLHTPLMLDVIRKFREAGRPVIWILFEGPTHQEGITADPDALLDGFRIEDGDYVVRKYHMNSFNNTNLSDIILSNDCDACLLMGMFAQHCVMSTFWGAFDKGVSPYMMIGGLISSDEKYCKLVIDLCKGYSMEELESNLRIHRLE